MTERDKTTVLRGGLDLVTPALAVDASRAIACVNYECEVRGYRRVLGYERLDGQTKPSEGQYLILNFTSGSTAVVAGDAVTGDTSGAVATAVISAVVESGSFAGGDAAGYLVLVRLSGTATTAFQDGEELNTGSLTADGTDVAEAASTDALDKTYRAETVAFLRAKISAVPGAGPVRGVVTYRGASYAIRDNAGATQGVMHRATTAGWQAISMGNILRFDAGTETFSEGEIVTGALSGATATLSRFAYQDGAFDGSAVGYMNLTSVTGTFQDNETITGATTGSATVNGTLEALTLAAGGHYEFLEHNFYGAAFVPRLYLVNGVGLAFEFDGTVFAPIETGLASSFETPNHVGQLNDHLVLGYPSGVLQNSAIGEPIIFDSTRGAASQNFGRPCTGILSDSKTVLLVFGDTNVGYFSGTSALDFRLEDVSNEAGAREWTAQQMESAMYLDNRGVRDLRATDAFGNFRAGSVTNDVEPIFRRKRLAGVTAAASIRVRARDQYRLFFSDLTGINIYMGRRSPEISQFELPDQVFCAFSGDDEDGREVLLVGAENGFVYELDKGTSFDGSSINALIRFPFDNFGSPQMEKRYHKAILEMDAARESNISISAEFGYGSPELPAGSIEDFSLIGGGGFWNEGVWNAFFWSSQVQGQAFAHIDGIGANLSLAILSAAADEDPHTLSSLTIHYSNRRLIR